MKILIFIIAFAGYSYFVYSSDECEITFQNIVQQQQPKGILKTLGLNKNKVAKQIQRIYKSHLQTRIADIEPDIPPLDLKILEEEHSHIPGHVVAEFYGKKVYLKPIETENDLKVLAALQTLRTIGVPVLFSGITQLEEEEDGPLYIMSPFKKGGIVTLWSASEISENLTSNKIKKQISDLYLFFSKNGVIPQDLMLFVSTTSDIFIVNSLFTFLGSSSSSSVSKDIKQQLNKINTNIERRRGIFISLTELSNKNQEDLPENTIFSNNQPPSLTDTFESSQTQKEPPILEVFEPSQQTQVEQPFELTKNTNGADLNTDSMVDSENPSDILPQTFKQPPYPDDLQTPKIEIPQDQNMVNPKITDDVKQNGNSTIALDQENFTHETKEDVNNSSEFVSDRKEELTRQEDSSEFKNLPLFLGNGLHQSPTEKRDLFPENTNNDDQLGSLYNVNGVSLDQNQPSPTYPTLEIDSPVQAQGTLSYDQQIDEPQQIDSRLQDDLALTLGIHESQTVSEEQYSQDAVAFTLGIHESQILSRTLGIPEPQLNLSDKKEASPSKQEKDSSQPHHPHSNVIPFARAQ